jgi:dihydropteroate synthase
MGILNVTPDSFSDGALYTHSASAIRHALQMISDGADIIDIGGESTRPGSDRVTADEELNRVIPVIEGILEQNPAAILSIDTYKAEVARKALQSGVRIVNDITALCFDREMPLVVKSYDATIILMHMKGEPRTMQDNPYYDNVIQTIKVFLHERILSAREHGIEQIIVDPGIGFGKRIQDNLEILKSLRTFNEIGYPVLIGPSRKSFIGKILQTDVDERLEGSLAAAVVGVLNGASILRVHDVAATKRALLVAHAVSLGAAYSEENWLS